MKVVQGWEDYTLLDASDGERLERWGKYTVVRPDPQIIFSTGRNHPDWENADAYYHRSPQGGGRWEFRGRTPDNWTVSWRNRIKLQVLLTSFKHTGVFPEQGVNWERYINLIKGRDEKPAEVLNLFGYTGGASIACLLAGAGVCHVDASKGMVGVARQNCHLSGVDQKPVRFIVDDCRKFIVREIKRNRRYDAIIMDPPSYGRGPSNEMWKLEDDIFNLVRQCRDVLTEDPLFFAINSYTASLSPGVMRLILSLVMQGYSGKVSCDEIGIPVENTELAIPSGSTAIYISDRG